MIANLREWVPETSCGPKVGFGEISEKPVAGPRHKALQGSRISTRNQTGLVMDVPDSWSTCSKKTPVINLQDRGHIDSQTWVGQSVPRPRQRDRVTQPTPGRLRRSPIETIIHKASIGCSLAPAGLGTKLYLPPSRKKGEILWSIRRNHRNLRGAENDRVPPGVSA